MANATTTETIEKLRTVRGIVQNIEKTFGKGAIMPLAGDDAVADINVIPSGSLALDAALGKKSPARRSAKPGAGAVDPRQRVDEDALECLRASAQAWARGNAANPRPEDVWDQLWSILEEAAVLKHPRKK